MSLCRMLQDILVFFHEIMTLLWLLRKKAHKKMLLFVLINLVANLLLNIWSCICQRDSYPNPSRPGIKQLLRLRDYLNICCSMYECELLLPIYYHHQFSSLWAVVVIICYLPWYNNFGVNLLPLPLPCACKYVNETN